MYHWIPGLRIANSEIHLALLGEGAGVLRVVQAQYVAPDTYRVLGPIPQGEQWQFQPGDVVFCTMRQLSTRGFLVAEQKVG